MRECYTPLEEEIIYLIHVLFEISVMTKMLDFYLKICMFPVLRAPYLTSLHAVSEELFNINIYAHAQQTVMSNSRTEEAQINPVQTEILF